MCYRAPMTRLVEKILTEAPPESGVSVLFERSPVATLLLATNGAVVMANPAAHRLLRCAPDRLVGASAALFFPELWRGASRSSVEVNDEDPPRRMMARRPDGTLFPARLRIVQVDSDRGLEFLATIDDLTEFEAALTESAAAVAAANKEFETFIDVAAHDLRAPLRILTGFTDALDDECAQMLNDEGRSFLKEILISGRRMEGIIDGLLALARSARCEMGCESLDLSTLVDLVLYELRHGELERSAECHVEPNMNGWGDVRLMMTVLRNLIGNAWKFTGRTPSAIIRVYTEQRDGKTWYCVTDNGAGFDMAHAGRLFKPFTRLHRQDEFPGHGIGLATVQRIVQRHAGEVEVQAAVGEGATVRFTLAPRPE
jgi:PAS domain S-box-containing protein